MYSATRKFNYLAVEHNFYLASNQGSRFYMFCKWTDAFAVTAEITRDTSKATL